MIHTTMYSPYDYFVIFSSLLVIAISIVLITYRRRDVGILEAGYTLGWKKEKKKKLQLMEDKQGGKTKDPFNNFLTVLGMKSRIKEDHEDEKKRERVQIDEDFPPAHYQTCILM